MIITELFCLSVLLNIILIVVLLDWKKLANDWEDLYRKADARADKWLLKWLREC